MVRLRVLANTPHLAAEGVAILDAAGLDLHTMEAFPTPERLAEVAARLQVDAIIARQGRINGLVMDASPNLRIIARHGAGTDEVDLDAARARNLLVTRTPGANARAVAEHTLALILALFKDIPGLGRGLSEGGWRTGKMRSRDLAGARLGLYGMGPVGREVARLASLFGMQVSAFSRQTARDVYRHANRVESLEALLAGSDVLSLHAALTPETRHIIGAAALARLPAGAFVVNTARGGLIDEAALIAALDSGHIAGAGLDVTAPEPPPEDHPLRRHPKVVLTPHMAGVTEGAMAQMAIQAAECVVAKLTGQAIPPERIVVPG